MCPFQEQLSNLKKLVYGASNTVLVLCTGTLAVNHKRDARKLLDALKGVRGQQLTDEGFLSSFHVRGSDYACVRPPGVNDGALQGVETQLATNVELHGTALARYLFQFIRLQRDGKEGKSLDAKLANYTNMHLYYASLHNCLDAILSSPDERAPKLLRAVDLSAAAAGRGEKVVVMAGKRCGFKTLFSLMQHRGQRDGFGVAEYGQLAEYNSKANARGELLAALRLDTDQAGLEGVDLHAVRLHVFCDVPNDFVAYRQRVGRSVRCKDHALLPPLERTVTYVMLVAKFPPYGCTELGIFLLLALSGYFGRSVAKTYTNAEPSPKELEATTRKVLRDLEARGVRDLLSLGRRRVGEVESMYEDSVQTKKLQTRCWLCSWHVDAI